MDTKINTPDPVRMPVLPSARDAAPLPREQEEEAQGTLQVSRESKSAWAKSYTDSESLDYPGRSDLWDIREASLQHFYPPPPPISDIAAAHTLLEMKYEGDSPYWQLDDTLARAEISAAFGLTPSEELLSDPTGVGWTLLFALEHGGARAPEMEEAAHLQGTLSNARDLLETRRVARRMADRRRKAEEARRGLELLARQTVKARAQERSRQRSRKEMSTAFQQSGGELNPGPGAKAGEPAGKQKRKQRKAAQASLRIHRPVLAAAPSLGQAISQGVAAAAASASEQREKGEKDASATKEAEALEAELEAKLAEWKAAASRSAAGTYSELDEYAGQFWFHPLCEEPWFPQFCGVARTRDELTILPWPHRIASAKLIEVRLALDRRVEDGKLKVAPSDTLKWTPTLAETARAPGVYREVVFSVTIFHCKGGLEAEPVALETENITFSWEQWCAAHTRRLCSGSFWNVIDKCRTFRAGHHTSPQSDSSAQNASWLCDNVFAALMFLETTKMTQDAPLLVELGYKALSRRILRELSDQDGPIAGGTYVRGYHVEFRDLWPEQWNAAVERVASGEDLDAAVKTMVESVTAAGSSLKETGRVFKDRCFEKCRALPYHIQGVHPAFSDPTSLMNQGLGFMKRLIPVTLACEPEAAAYEQAVCSGMAEWVAKEQPPPDVEDEEATINRLMESTHGKGWTQLQIEEFLKGAKDVLEAVRDGPTAVKRFFSDLEKRLTEHGVFVKREPYPMEEIKVLRYIVAPAHYIRGVAQALFQEAQDRIARVFHDHNVKERTRSELLEELSTSLPTGDAQEVIESDFKSFESLINRVRRLRNETPVLLAAVCRQKRLAAQEFQNFLSKRLTLKGPLFWAELDSIRLSGEFLTSIANMIENVGMSFSSFFRQMKVPLEEVPARFQGWTLPWRCEGDDGIFVLPRKVVAGLTDMYRRAGARVEVEFHNLWTQANFCGFRARECADGKTRLYMDPLEKIAMLTHSLNPEMDTDHKDPDLQAAKAMSYLREGGHLPMLVTLCRRILTEGELSEASAATWTRGLFSRASAVDRVETRALKSLHNTGTSSFDRFVRDAVAAYHGIAVADPEQAVREWAAATRALLAVPDHVTADMRDEVARFYPELTKEVQLRIEQQIRVAKPGVPMDIPELRQIFQRCEAVQRMEVRTFRGKREEAKDRLEKAASAAAHAYSGVSTLTSRWVLQGVAWLQTLGVVLGTMVAATLGYVTLVGAASPWLLVLGMTGSLLAALGATALAWGIMVVLLGFSFAAARRVTAGFWLMMLALVGVGFVCRSRGLVAAAMQKPEAAAGRPGRSSSWPKTRLLWQATRVFLGWDS